MISTELKAAIRRYFHVEHWKIGTIAAELRLHPDTVRAALETHRFSSQPCLRHRLTDPYLDFLRETLQRHPRLRATRLFEMIRQRGYTGSVVQLRRVVTEIRPLSREAFLRLDTFPGEQAQADWAHFGDVTLGHARRRLSAFLLTLSYSRALWLEFFFDQSLENFLLSHVHAFQDWGGAPRVILYDNLRSVVLERWGDAIHFHPRLLEFIRNLTDDHANRHAVEVDATDAVRARLSTPLIGGRAVLVRGDYDSKGVLHAQAILRAKDSAALWPADR